MDLEAKINLPRSTELTASKPSFKAFNKIKHLFSASFNLVSGTSIPGVFAGRLSFGETI